MEKKKIMKIIIILAVIIIPVMYSFFYLKAFWDPYGNLHDMKIAVVNLDEGDSKENLGNDLVKNLQDKDVMSLVILNDSDKAQEGLINEEYYATITIPKNFTNDLNNAANENRKTTTITYSPNQKSNYLASQIINKVVTTVETQLRGEVSKKVVATLSDKLNEVPEQLQTISDGADQIQNGGVALENGLEQLNDGTNKLNNSYTEFDNGVDSAYSGSKELSSGLTKLNSGADKLVGGTNKLASSTENLSKLTDGVNELSAGTNTLNTNVSNYVDGVNTAISSIEGTTKEVTSLATNIQKYYSAHPEAMQDSSFQAVMKSLQTISSSSGNTTGLETLKSSGTKLKAGTSTLNTKVQQFSGKTSDIKTLVSGIQTLNNGMIELKQGLSTASAGSTNLQNGLSKLSENSKKVETGIQGLNTGSQSALTGSKTLVEGTKTFKSKIDEGLVNTKEELKSLNGLDEYVENPVKIEEVDYAGISSYGVGFAPYFMSISLWVGALIMLIIFYYDPEDRFKLLGRNAKNKFLRTALYFGISVAQGIVLGFLLKSGLGFSVTNIWLYYGTCILTSAVFFSIMQLLVLNLGDVGKFLGILFLVLQLAASGGTFPIETVPKFFQSIYNFMPMNYTIRLIKEAIIQINTNTIGKNVLILLGIFIVSITINAIADYIKIKHPKKDANQ